MEKEKGRKMLHMPFRNKHSFLRSSREQVISFIGIEKYKKERAKDMKERAKVAAILLGISVVYAAYLYFLR